MSAELVKVSNEFTQAIDIFRKIKYDIVAPGRAFDDDLEKFQNRIEDLDKRLAYVEMISFPSHFPVQ